MLVRQILSLFLLIALIVGCQRLQAQEVAPVDSLATPAFGDTLRHTARNDSLAVGKKKEPPIKSRVKYKATDSLKFRVSQKEVYLYKDAEVKFEDKELTANRVQFEMDTKLVHAGLGKDSVGAVIGSPVFKQGSETIESDSLTYNFNNSKGIIHGTRTQQGEGFLHATKAKRYVDHIDMAGGNYTTCDAKHPHFYLALSKAKVIPGDQVVFGPAHLVLLDVPLPLFLPFGFFPQNNRKAVSGLLMPSFGMEVSRGLSLTNGGYYFAFSDHFDATVRGDIYSTGTWRINTATRYMKRYRYSGNLNFNYGVTVSGEKGLDRQETKQYSIQWTHSQDAKANPSQNFSASVNYSSSSYDREFNYTNPNQLYTNTKNSSISYQKSWPNTPFRLTANFNHSQSQNAGTQMVNITFPTINFSMDRLYPFRPKESSGKAKWYEDITLQYDASLTNTLTGSEGDLFTSKNFRNMRNGFQHKIPLSVNFKVLKIINITPSMTYTGVAFLNKINKEYDEDFIDPVSGRRGLLRVDTTRNFYYAQAVSPNMSVSVNPKFYLTNVYGPNAKVEAIRTVISPTASFSYVPDMNFLSDNYGTYTDANGREQKYPIYEGAYSIPSAPGQSGSVSVGLNGNVEMKVRSAKDTTGVAKKIKLLDRFDMRSSYNLFADSMKWSNISIGASTTIAGINLTMTGTVNPYYLTPQGTRIDKWGPKLTNISFNTGITLPFKKKEEAKTEGKDADKDKTGKKADDDGYSYWDVPWNVNISYSMGYSKPVFDGRFTQNLNFSGSITLTKNWTISFQSAYDFDAKKISYLTSSIQRDLHCWTMSINFSPIGPSQYVFFTINVKSGTLRDLKYEKRKSQYDFSTNTW